VERRASLARGDGVCRGGRAIGAEGDFSLGLGNLKGEITARGDFLELWKAQGAEGSQSRYWGLVPLSTLKRNIMKGSQLLYLRGCYISPLPPTWVDRRPKTGNCDYGLKLDQTHEFSSPPLLLTSCPSLHLQGRDPKLSQVILFSTFTKTASRSRSTAKASRLKHASNARESRRDDFPATAA
jgi:hypothetical protein